MSAVSENGDVVRNFGLLAANIKVCDDSSHFSLDQEISATTKRMGSKNIIKVRKNTIPCYIIENSALNEAIGLLPGNYNFEIHKTVWRIVKDKICCVALQFPEGLLMYSCVIADILKSFAGTKVLLLGDVTYGACCVDDYTSLKLGADLIIHYGHSCLVPVNITKVPTMYVFVEIFFDSSHLIRCLVDNFAPDIPLALMGTVQFISVLQHVKQELVRQGFTKLSIPQARPLSMGETLGCTSPHLDGIDSLVFVADGRFHLEAAMIRNSDVKAYRYDPYSKVLSKEGYDVVTMKSTRLRSIETARNCRIFGLILGTLGRQGSKHIFDRLQDLLKARGRTVIPFLMAEINPKKLELLSAIECWVQVACPRLSIDWGQGFSKPILTPYETEVCLGESDWLENYPMDYYSQDGGKWSNMYHRFKKL